MDASPAGTTGYPAYDPPWLALPKEVSDMLRPTMPGIVEAIIAAVPQLVPAYARPIEGRFGRRWTVSCSFPGPRSRRFPWKAGSSWQAWAGVSSGRGGAWTRC